MKILHSLYYYRPHYSGLTVYTERLVRALGRRGHQVTVLTSRYDKRLAPSERMDGVEIRRLPVLMKISKGPVMPALLFRAIRSMRDVDVVHLHVPQLDAAPIALAARLLGKPIILTYHCDLRLPTSPVNLLANWLSWWANRIAVAAADVVVANALDYAQASPILRRHLNKIKVSPPPIDIPKAEESHLAALRERCAIQPGQKIIGMAARLASEKGVEFLAQAIPSIRKVIPDVRVLYVGQFQDVMGEQVYARRIQDMIDGLGDVWTFLGVLEAQEMAAFFTLCDVTLLPSLNSTESYGMVQVESMLSGTPVVASDLPGVRQPITLTGMGALVPPGDSDAIAQAVLAVLQNPQRYWRARHEIEAHFSTEQVTEQYEQIYKQALALSSGSSAR